MTNDRIRDLLQKVTQTGADDGRESLGAAVAAGPHPVDDDLLALDEGRLSTEQGRVLRVHLALCCPCASRLVMLCSEPQAVSLIVHQEALSKAAAALLAPTALARRLPWTLDIVGPPGSAVDPSVRPSPAVLQWSELVQLVVGEDEVWCAAASELIVVGRSFGRFFHIGGVAAPEKSFIHRLTRRPPVRTLRALPMTPVAQRGRLDIFFLLAFRLPSETVGELRVDLDDRAAARGVIAVAEDDLDDQATCAKLMAIHSCAASVEVE